MVSRPGGFSFCFFVLCGCDFPLTQFWSVRVTSSAEYEANALQREIWRDYGIQSKIVPFFRSSPPFLNAVDNKGT